MQYGEVTHAWTKVQDAGMNKVLRVRGKRSCHGYKQESLEQGQRCMALANPQVIMAHKNDKDFYLRGSIAMW